MTRKTCWPFERGRTHFLTRSLRQLFARLLCSCFVGCFVRCFVTPQNYLTASCGARSFELAATPKFDQNSHKISTKLENFFATSRQLFAGATTFWRPIRESSGSTSCCLVRLGSGATLCREICRTAPAQNDFRELEFCEARANTTGTGELQNQRFWRASHKRSAP